MSDAQDKQLPASERKIRRAREDGQVPRSRELGHLAALAGGGALLVVAMPWLLEHLRRSFARSLSLGREDLVRSQAMHERLSEGVWTLLVVAVPLGLVMMVLALGAAIAVGGWNMTLKPLQPSFGKLDPLAGLRRMVSRAHLGDMTKSCVLAMVMSVVGFAYLHANAASFQAASSMSALEALRAIGDLVVVGLSLLMLALAAFAVVDVPLQRLLLARRLRMSHEEVKQEFKTIEGNALIKGRLRARMRELASRRQMAAVPTADLVVMNPTHYAVALRYDESSMAAPKVVAKGADHVALRIREVAQAARVPVLQMPPLARALYAHTDVDQTIPAPLFAAVAQVLAYVYQLRAAVAANRPAPPLPDALVVPPQLDPLTAKVAA